jgi:hypothetical protein
MTEQEMDYIANKIASQLISFMETVPRYTENIFDGPEDEEQRLLVELATAMTQLDSNLKKENYSQCEKLKNQIYIIENKLNKFK